MITKPEQAVPHDSCDGFMHTIRGRDSVDAWFTAKEAAEIAKAYLAAYLKEKRALLRPDSEHKKAAANLREWRRKFKEWSK